jgi:hypothetical protein
MNRYKPLQSIDSWKRLLCSCTVLQPHFAQAAAPQTQHLRDTGAVAALQAAEAQLKDLLLLLKSVCGKWYSTSADDNHYSTPTLADIESQLSQAGADTRSLFEVLRTELTTYKHCASAALCRTVFALLQLVDAM